MTRESFFISILCQKSTLNYATISKIFEIVKTRDWEIFCSQMADFDKPDERKCAKEKFEEEINSIKTDKNKEQIEKVIELINNSTFYKKYFHSLTEDYHISLGTTSNKLVVNINDVVYEMETSKISPYPKDIRKFFVDKITEEEIDEICNLYSFHIKELLNKF